MKETDVEKFKKCLDDIGCIFRESPLPLGGVAVVILGAALENSQYIELSALEFDAHGKFQDIDFFG